MKLRFCLLADAARIREGKLDVVGEFHVINSSQFPVRLPTVTFVASIELEAADIGREFAFEVRYMDVDGKAVIHPVPVEAKFDGSPEPGGLEVQSLVLQLDQFPILTPGVWVLDFCHNGEAIGRCRFTARRK